MVEIEVKEEPMLEAAAVVRSNGTRRFTRSIIKSKDNKLESEFPGGLQDAISLEVEVLEREESNARKMETSKKTVIKGRPKMVKELFGTGLLEGYPVFYNGGKRVFFSGTSFCWKECASLLSISHAKWYCSYCQNKFQKETVVEHNSNAVAAGRVLAIDPIEQITNRCIHDVKNPEEAELMACVICRGYNFSKSGFGPRTVLLCDSEKRNIR